MTAKTDQGIAIAVGRKVFQHLGRDLSGNQSLDSWEIKEIVDSALKPGRNTERFITPLPEGTKGAEVEVKVTMFPGPHPEVLIHRIVKTIRFEE